MPTQFKVSNLGPGIIIAATGLGAGDLIAATVSGAKFGTTILWVVLVGAVLKLCLNEGLARWQIATGTTLLQGWLQYLPRWVGFYFLAYLFLWGFLVAAAIMSACGIAAHALFPQLSVSVWAIIHALVALVLILYFKYSQFENLMKLLIALMFAVVIYAGFKQLPPIEEIILGLLVPQIPPGSFKYLLGVIGGVGGSVTLLCYGYWLQEKSWNQESDLTAIRLDLTVAYLLTALFAIALIIIASGIQPELVKGADIVVALADKLELSLGATGRWIFLLGFWGAVFSSMLGVWQGVPYLFEDFLSQRHRKDQEKTPNQAAKNTDAEKSALVPSHLFSSKLLPHEHSKPYILFLLFLTFPPMLMLVLQKPVWLVIIYSVVGAFFMPFVAFTLLYLNNRFISLKHLRNSGLSNLFLLIALALFALLFINKLLES